MLKTFIWVAGYWEFSWPARYIGLFCKSYCPVSQAVKTAQWRALRRSAADPVALVDVYDGLCLNSLAVRPLLRRSRQAAFGYLPRKAAVHLGGNTGFYDRYAFPIRSFGNLIDDIRSCCRLSMPSRRHCSAMLSSPRGPSSMILICLRPSNACASRGECPAPPTHRAIFGQRRVLVS